MDLGVSQAGVVIDHGVDERVSHQRIPCFAAGFVGGGDPVAVAVGTAHVAPPAAIGDVAQLLHIDMDQAAGVVMLVAAHRFTGGPVHMGESVEPVTGQDLVDRGRRDPGLGGELDRAQAFTPPQQQHPPHHPGRRRTRLVVGT